MPVTETEVNIEAVREFLDREQVHTVECMFADTWGVPRGKRLSAPHFCSAAEGHGFAIANVAFTWDMHGFIFPTEFVNDVTGYPDMHVVPDISTLRLAAWKEGTAFCLCDTIDPETGAADPVRRARDPAPRGGPGAEIRLRAGRRDRGRVSPLPR